MKSTSKALSNARFSYFTSPRELEICRCLGSTGLDFGLKTKGEGGGFPGPLP